MTAIISVLQQAGLYVDMGLAVVPVPHLSKQCRLPDWQRTRLDRDSLPIHFTGEMNIAAVLGNLSGGVICVDCDWSEAAELASLILPSTLTYGRESCIENHWLIKCPGLTESIKYNINGACKPADRRSSIIEILTDGHQCLLPGSTHPSGERVSFTQPPDSVPMVEVSPEVLKRKVGYIAGASVLVYHWSNFDGSRHDLTLALTGACLHGGWSSTAIVKVFGALFETAKDPEVRDRKQAVTDSINRFNEGGNVSGWPKASELLGDLAPLIEEMWQLNPDPLQMLNIGEQPTGSGWPELVPFDESDVEHRNYPLAALRDLKPVVETIAHVQQAPVGLVAQCVLAAVATAIQGLYDIEVPHGRYPLSLYLLTLGETGERKSSTDGVAFKPHDEWITKTLGRLSMEPEETGPTFQPYLFFEGGTVEGLRKQLAHHWPSIICNNTDAADFLGGHSMREGRDVPTAAFLSKLWEGQLRGYMRGQDNRPVSLYGRRVSLSWMIQPQHVETLVSSSMATQGLLSRLLIAYPESLIGQRKYVLPDVTHRSILDSYSEQITELLNRPLEMDPVTGQITAVPLYLDDPAQRLYANLNDHYEASLAPTGINVGIRDYANKAGQHLARLAGVLSAYESASVVTVDHLERAKELLDYYLAEWRDLHQRLGALAPKTQKPRMLIEWLRTYTDKHPGPFKLRTVCQLGPRACDRSADSMKALLAVLIQRGYVRTATNNQYELRPANAD